MCPPPIITGGSEVFGLFEALLNSTGLGPARSFVGAGDGFKPAAAIDVGRI